MAADGDGDGLRERVAALEARVAALEAQAGERDETAVPVPADSAAAPVAAVPVAADPHTFWALDVLRQRSGPEVEVGGYSGSILFAGVLRTPGIPELVWQEERPSAALLRTSWDDVAEVLSALGHPIRLEIVRRLLSGAFTTSDLASIPALGTSGQLYHHLRELQGAGLVVQRRRNHYAVPPDRVIPCLTLIAASLSGARLVPDDETATAP